MEERKDRNKTNNQVRVSSHKDLHVWQRAMELVESVYTLTKSFPKEELFGLTSQMRRAAISIPSNIAEGRSRGGRKEFINFLHISLGSLSELETQLAITKRLSLSEEHAYNKVERLLTETRKMLLVMIRSLKANSSKL